jgi:hypothetical protein
MKLAVLALSGSLLLASPAFATIIGVPEPGSLTLIGTLSLAGVLAYRLISRR